MTRSHGARSTLAARMLSRWLPVLLGVAASPALATQPAPTLDANAFHPTVAPGDGLMVPSAAAEGTGLFAAVSYARRPLAFRGQAGGVARSQVVFGDLSLLELGAAHPVGPVLLEANLPIATVIRGGGPNLLGIDAAHAPAFGDLRVGARWRAWHRDDRSIGTLDVALRGGWALPTAAASSWLGGSAARFDVAALAAWRMGAWSAALELGALLRPLDAVAIDVVDPASGQPVTGGDGAPLRETALASGSRFVGRLRVAYDLPVASLTVAGEGQLFADLDPDATEGQLLADGALVAEMPLHREAFRLFAAVGGAATRSWGSAQVRAIAGLRFRPDRMPSDRDGDGLDDRDDACPEQAEDKDGFEDADGCPDLDDDGDGVPDTADRCRLEPEDKDGFEDADGCPDLDDDRDGVPDAADRCPRPTLGKDGKPGPSTVEDKDGFEDADGCPDPDNDGDGIPDGDDFCPDARETVNGYEDADGCPDTPPPPLAAIEHGRILLARPIRFEPGTDRVDAEGRTLLGAVATLLRAQKAVTAIEVAVFTDDAGTPEERLARTQSRAEVVKAMLVGSSGLQAHQIKATGMGDAMPLASQDTPENRSRNRRVELRVLAGPEALPPLQPPTPPSTRKRRRR
ncbi:MAG: hypothetical protein RIT45_2834 [Pseudomonadota bacterium]